jgi:hypothetical protein
MDVVNLDGELHGVVAVWFPVILLTTISLVLSFNARPTNRREWAITLWTYGQLAVPFLLSSLLVAAGADHEGGWQDSRLHLGLSAALVVVPIVSGIWISCVARGRRVPAILMAISTSVMGAMMLFGFMIIGC